jgi:hypothetical protein
MAPSVSAEARVLDELAIVVAVDNATDALSSVAASVPQLAEWAHLISNLPRSGQIRGHDCIQALAWLSVARHGFSALATARHGERPAAVLFDVGRTAQGGWSMPERLGVDLGSIDVLFVWRWRIGTTREP